MRRWPAHLSEAKAWDWHEIAKAIGVTEVNVPQAEPTLVGVAHTPVLADATIMD